MNSENNNENNESPDAKFKQTLDHLKTGYSNAQEIIRFVDTKTSYLTGAATVTTGFILEAARQYSAAPGGIKQNFEFHPYLSCVLITIGQYALFAGGLCLWCCVLCLVARPPEKKWNHGLTVLFPFYGGAQPEQDYVTRSARGLTTKQILKEYEIQVWNIGLILHKKVIRHRWAVKMFLAQLTLLVLAGMVVLFCLEN